MKILVVTLSNLGDVVLTLPVIQSLKQAFPDSELDVIAGESGRAVFENDPRVRQVTLYNKKISFAEKWRFLKAVRARRYDLILDLRHSAIGLLGGAKRRNAYRFRSSRRAHRADRHLESLRGIAPVWDRESFLKDTARGSAAVQLPAERIIAAAVGSKSDTKKWPAEKFAELLDRLALEEKCSVVLIGDSNDAKDAARVRSLMRAEVLDLSGRTSFKDLVQVIRRAALVITNDSAPLHIADSLKIPTLAIFGPTDLLKYGPRRAGSASLSKDLFCQPCEKAQCRYGHECLKELEVHQVYNKAIQVMNDSLRAENFKLLIVRLDRVGDAVLSLPAIEALRLRFPQAKISVMTRPFTQALLEGHPLIDEVIPYRYEKKGRHAFGIGYFRLLREISKRRFDAAVILHPGIRSYLIPFLCAIPHRIGYEGPNARLLTRAVPDERSLGQKHESRYALDLVSVLETQTDKAPKTPALPVSLFDRQRISEMLEKNGVGRSEMIVALHPGASCPSKRWPQENFRSLTEKILKETPFRVAVVGAEQEKEAARFISEGLGSRVLDLSARLTLKELAALFSRCEILISNDSGPVHVAAAVGTRVISLFGRNQAGLSAERWKPLGPGHAVIQKDVGCEVCLAHKCTIGFECMKAIRVEDVMEKFREMIQAGVQKG